jgi:hypothetical protein
MNLSQCLAHCQSIGESTEDFSKIGESVSYIFYFIVIYLLAYWVENPFFPFANSLIMRSKTGPALEHWLENFNWRGRQSLEIQGQMPKYKYYGEVIEVLLSLARKFGGSYQESFLYLREGLQVDQQFEKKLWEATLGLYLQMGLMLSLTWLFIFASLKIADVPMNGFYLLIIFLWQLTGLASLPFILGRLRKIYFGDIGKLWKILYVLRSLQKIPISRSEAFNLAGIKDLSLISRKKLLPIVSKLKEATERTLKLGTSYEDDVNYLMGELRFQEKWHFELFEKRLIVIKMTLLSVFFLPSYLAFTVLLLGDLMNLMSL